MPIFRYDSDGYPASTSGDPEWKEISNIYRWTGSAWQKIKKIYRFNSTIAAKWQLIFQGTDAPQPKTPFSSLYRASDGETQTFYSGNTVRLSRGGWTQSPTSYRLRIQTSNNPAGGYTSVADQTYNSSSIPTAANTTDSTYISYTITDTDALYPSYYIKGLVQATNADGTTPLETSAILLRVGFTLSNFSISSVNSNGATFSWSISGVPSQSQYIYSQTLTIRRISDNVVVKTVDITPGTNTTTVYDTVNIASSTGYYAKLVVTANDSWRDHVTSPTTRTSDFNSFTTSGGMPIVDLYPTISLPNGYKTQYSSSAYIGDTTDGTPYDTPIFRGNTGTWTPDPTSVGWLFQYSSSGTGGWTSFYDFEGLYVGGTDTNLENQDHDWYLDNFYTSAGASGTVTDSAGYYIRFGSKAYNGLTDAPINYSSAIGPIYAAPSSPGSPTITWVSSYNSSYSYISAYWSAATTKFTYYLQYYDGSSWVTLGSGTTSNPTSIAPAGPYLAPHGTKLYRVINKNADGVFAKSASVSFDAQKAPGNISNVVLRNFTTANGYLFLTTGTDTTSVQYTYVCASNTNFTIGPFTQSTASSYPYKFINDLSGYFTSKTWNADTYSPSTTYYLNNTVWYAGNQYRLTTTRYASTFPYNEIGVSGFTPSSSQQYWTAIQIVTYNPGDYLTYNGTRYYCKVQTSGTYPVNTTYWTANYLPFYIKATPYNGTKVGTEYTHPDNIFIRVDTNSDTVAISSGPTFSGITQSAINATYLPSIYTNRVIINVKTGSPLASLLGYPYTKTVSGATEYTESLTGLNSNTTYYFYMTPRYSYNDAAGVYYEGSQATGNSTTLVNLSPPTPSSVTYTSPTTFSVAFAGGSGPYYQLYWGASSTAPGNTNDYYDSASTGTPIIDYFTPSDGSTYYFWVRSSTVNLGNTSTSGNATAGTYSNWSSTYVSITPKPLYTVTFAVNGATGSPSVSSVTQSSYGGSVTLATVGTMTKTGYSFGGWSDGTNTYTSGGSYTPTSSIQLSAIWNILTYTISYNANSGTGAPSSQTKTYNVDLTLSSTTPTRTGYTFNGWNTASNGSGTSYAAGDTYTSNSAATLYAQWTSNNVAPTISASSISPATGTAGTTTYTASATASGTPSPTLTYQWQYFSSSSYSYVNVPSATSSTYAPPSNFNTLYPNFGFYCLITATNAAGSATARPTATLNSPTSSAGTTTASATDTTGAGGRFDFSNTTATGVDASGITYYWTLGTSSNYTQYNALTSNTNGIVTTGRITPLVFRVYSKFTGIDGVTRTSATVQVNVTFT